jgi:lipopolysaccharide transport protein LptA
VRRSRGSVVAALLSVALVGAGAAGAEEEAQEAAARFGLNLSAEAPTSIRAQQLEASRDSAGRERVIFEGKVDVEQGDLRIFCDWLEATYPKSGEGGPERLVSRGNVRILQGEREARCTEAIFEPPRNRAVCRSSSGPASLRRGDDVVEGEEIVFDLARSTVRVSGSAIVRMAPREETKR